jgi:hypothetical protein
MMRATAIVLSAGILFCTSFAFATNPTAPADKPVSNTPVRRSLDRPIPEIRFTGNSFSDCIDFLTDATGANIVVDWKALEAAKVTKDTPITLRLSTSIRLRKVLTLMLDQAGGAGVLTFYVDQGVLTITSQEQADKELITRLYPIQDLLFQHPDYNDAPTLSIQSNNATAGGGGGGGGASGGGPFGGGGGGSTDTNNTSNNMTSQQRADEIIKLITDTVRPEIWKVNGGNATISFIRGNLVVSAPRSVHEMLSSQ